MKPNKSCCVCAVADSNYKCPVCRKPYCSVTCCKEHKASESCQPFIAAEETKIEVNTTPTPSYMYPTEDTVPLEKLSELGNSEELKSIMSNPHLQTILAHLDSAKNPKAAMEDAMQEPLFVEFANACLKVVDP